MGHPKDTGKGPSQVAVALRGKCVWNLLNLLHLLSMTRVYEHADLGCWFRAYWNDGWTDGFLSSLVYSKSSGPNPTQCLLASCLLC